MKDYINIKLYILLASLFLLFNLSCEDDDYPTITDEIFTYEVSWATSITNANGDNLSINYADNNSVEWQTITITLLEIDSDGNPTGKANASVLFSIITDETTDASLNGLTDNKATTDANGEITLIWNDTNYVGAVEIDFEYNEDTSPDLPITFTVHSVYEKVKNLQVIDDLTFELPLEENDEQILEVRVTDETSLDGVGGIDVQIEFDAQLHPYLSVPNGTIAQTDSQGYATFTIRLTENNTLDIAISANDNSIDVPMIVKIENDHLDCTNCSNGVLSEAFNTEINQTSTQTDNAYATINDIYVTIDPPILILNSDEDDQTLNVNAYVYKDDGDGGNEAVPGINVKFSSAEIIVPSTNIILTNEQGLAQLSLTNFDNITEGEIINIVVDVTIVNEDGSNYTNSNGETFSDDINAQVGYQLGFNILNVNTVSLTVAGSSSLILSDTSSGNNDDDSGDGDGDGGDNDGEEDNSSATDEDNNSFTLNASVTDAVGIGISGIPVVFEMPNGYGQLSGEVLTDENGMAQNVLQNITTPNASVLESFDVVAKVIDPTDDTTILATSTITLQVGNQLAYNFPNFDLITMQIEPSLLIFNDIPSDSDTGDDGDDEGEDADDTATSTNSVTITASVRDIDAGPLPGVPVHFSNPTPYGTFSANNVASSEDGTTIIDLQNINIPDSPGAENILISANIINPADGSVHAFDEQTLEVAYQSVININSVFDLTTARIQSLDSENNINIQYADTIKAWVNNINGDGVENVPIQFSLQPNDDNEIVGLISNDEVWTDQNGYAYVVFSLTEANLIDYADDESIGANVQVYVTDELTENEEWEYFIEGSPNIEYDVDEFHFYSSGLPETWPEITIMTGDTLMLPFIAKDESGIRIANVPVRFEIYGSTNPNRSYGDLSSSLTTTCCNDSTTIFEDIDGNGTATLNENMGIATTNYNNIIIEQTTIDSIRAWITDPLTGNTLFDDSLSVIVNPPDTQVSSLFSYPIPETILMDTMDSVYCDTITAIASDIQGQSLSGVNIYFSLAQEDQQYGYISNYFTVTDSIPNTGFYGSRTTFCTYPNISLENNTSHTININVTTPFTDPVLQNDVEIYLVEDLPDCPDCEASLTLISEYYELPAGNNDIFSTLVTATVIDSTENPVPENTYVEFQSLTENDEGDLVPIGSIEPIKFTDDQGIATATFSMGTDVGLAQIIATAPTFNLADTMYINLESTDATALELVNPFPNEIMVQGGGGIESSELTMLIKDGSGNLVTEPFLVHFEILNSAPIGVYLNEHDENDYVECAESSNGEATVTLNSGTQPGSVPIRAELYPLDVGVDCNSINSGTFTSFGIASLESVPVTVVTGPPEFGQINYSYVDITPIGGGLYEVPLSVNLWDFYSNPVADSTNVYIWIEGIAPAWSADSLYALGDTVKWGDIDALGNIIEVDSLLYVWNSELFDDDDLNSPLPGDGFELTGSLLWLPIAHPGAVVGEAKTGMEAPDGQSYPGVAWSNVHYGTSNMFDNTVIKALTYDSDGQKLIIDGRDSHNGEGLILPFQPGVLSIAASVQFWNFSVFGDVGLNDLDDTVAVDIQSNLTDYYQYPVDNGTILINAPGGNIWAVCDPADTDNDGFIGCCDSFDVIGGTGTGNGDGVCDQESDFDTCSECVAGGGAWIPDAAQDDPNIFGTQINGPNDVADDPAYGKTNGNGQVLWNISYSEGLNPGDAQNPETYEDFTSTVTTQLLDPIQTASDGVDILLIKSEVNENP